MPPGSPNRAPAKRLHFWSPPSTNNHSSLLTYPLPRFPNGNPIERERHPFTLPSTSHPLKIHLSHRVPSKAAPSMFSNRVPMDRDTPSPEPLVYLFMYVCWSPQKRSPTTKWGKTSGYRPHSPMQAEGIHTMGRDLVPQRDC